MSASRFPLVVSSLLLAAGLASAGYFIGRGITARDQGSRSVAVKGLSEKEVPASVAIWTLTYTATGNDLMGVNKSLGDSTGAVRTFLKEAGFDDKDMAVQPPSVRDLSLDVRDKDAQPLTARYSATQSVLLRTSKVDEVKPAVASVSKLMASGVLLWGRNEPTYFFDRLNDIKPGMIEEATKNARVAAEQFARDSQTQLGDLLSAEQGRFQIDDRDAATPERKMVRVIVEVRFSLD